jgi:phosphoglucomutase
MTQIFYFLRHTSPPTLSYLRSLGPHAITRIQDPALNYDSLTDPLPEDTRVVPSQEMITFEVGGSVVTLRGSGTEPKLKYYVEAKWETMEEAEKMAGEVERALREWLGKFGLE